jgi:hypothetical protein
MAVQVAGLALGYLIQDTQAKQEKYEREVTAYQVARNRAGEAERLKGEANGQAAQVKSDRIREAERELGMVRVAAAEGSGMGARLAGEVGFFEGLDLSRIESNRKAHNDSLDAQIATTYDEASRGVVHAQSLYDSQRTSAFLGTLGSGMKIYSNEYGRQTSESAATNRTSGGGRGAYNGDDTYFTNGDLANT